MDDVEEFHRAMATLLRQLGIQPPRGTADTCYEVAFSDGCKVYFANIEPGTIDIAAAAGELPASSTMTEDLLALNLPEPGRPLFVIAHDRATRNVLVRARIEMARAHGEGLRDLAWQMTERVAAVRACLQQGEARKAPSAAAARVSTLRQVAGVMGTPNR
jgi:hypothetical protein